MTGCVFCPPLAERVLAENKTCLAIRDGYPITPGHALVIPRRHVASIFDLSEEELSDLWKLLRQARDVIQASHSPSAFNIGVNDGPAAGQTVAHVHVHLIPRYAGDVSEPRGGVRWIIPSKAAYWREEP
jgi:diadenosine tetraphosphate (Ap4A) HIT family hydrolase